MEEKVLSEKESLALISGMISKAKNHYYESGLGALLWGGYKCNLFYPRLYGCHSKMV